VVDARIESIDYPDALFAFGVMLREVSVFLSPFLTARAKLAGSEQSWREGLKQEEQFPIMKHNGHLSRGSNVLLSKVSRFAKRSKTWPVLSSSRCSLSQSSS
jgi:hypothetical protein